MGSIFEMGAPPHDSDVALVDFRSMPEGTLTRTGHVIAMCPACGKLGERRRPRAGRRQVEWLHVVRYIHRAHGAWEVLDRDANCKQWEINDAPEQREFGGFIAGGFASEGDGT